MGDLPRQPNVQPISDPMVAHDAAGNFYFASLSLGARRAGAHSLISFYKMPAGSNIFQLVPVPVDMGSGENSLADKEYLPCNAALSGHPAKALRRGYAPRLRRALRSVILCAHSGGERVIDHRIEIVDLEGLC